MTGTRIKQYQILAEIGSGGMAKVYRALDTALEREVALKVLHAQYLRDPVMVMRFEKEAKSAAGLSHKNIIHLYEAGSVDNSFFFAMELVEGRDLDALLKSRGALPPEITALIGVSVCDALAYAHRKKLVHRDIKPSNIMIDDHGAVKLADFGLAKSFIDQDITGSQAMVGTPSYMAPEQIEKDQIGSFTDIYSLGVVLYQMLCGKKPFTGATLQATFFKITCGEYSALTIEAPALPPECTEWVEPCLRHQPSDRFGNTDELRALLLLFLKERGIAPRDEALLLFLTDPPRYHKEVIEPAVEKLLEKARYLEAMGKIPEAVRALDTARQMAPDHSAALELAIEWRKQHKEALTVPSIKKPVKSRTRKRLFKMAGILFFLLTIATAGLFYFTQARQSAVPLSENRLRVPVAAPSSNSVGPPAALPPANPLSAMSRPKVIAPAPIQTPQPALPAQSDAAQDSATPVTAGTVVPCSGYLFVYSEPWAELTVDNVTQGKTPTRPVLLLACGTHHIKLDRAGCKPYERRVEIGPRDTLRLQILLERM